MKKLMISALLFFIVTGGAYAQKGTAAVTVVAVTVVAVTTSNL